MMNNGILCVYKEKGCTSRDVVNKICKVFNTKKVGHTGTLDPLASGVLVLGINEGTKLIELITAYDKEYVATVRLGISTDTYDITGNVVNTCDASSVSADDVDEALKKFVCSYMQEVPIYSAVKINGKKLYEYARNGESIDLPKRMVTIYSLERISDLTYCDGMVDFKIKCVVSKGTYIRSLIKDIGSSIGFFSCMVDLERTRQGNFSTDNCYTLDDIVCGNYKLIDINSALSNFKRVVVDETIEKKVINGAIIFNKYDSSLVLFVDKSNNVIALYKKYDKDDKMLKPWKMFRI